MSDIFICYSRKDRAVADRLLDRLSAESWSVWMDTRLQTGTKWRKEIQKELAAARSVVVLWSAAAEESDYVMDEAEDARKRGILVPALIESMPLPYGFRHWCRPRASSAGRDRIITTVCRDCWPRCAAA